MLKLSDQRINDSLFMLNFNRYNVQWYRTPLQIQRMILFLLQRGTKEFTLNVGGLLHGSMENFAMVRECRIIQ